MSFYGINILKKINVYTQDQGPKGTRYPPASQQDSQYPTQSDTVLKIIWYEATWKFYPWYLKYPIENEVPRNTQSNISILLANPNPPATRLFCSLPDPNPPNIEKTLPVKPCSRCTSCFFNELSWGGLLRFFMWIAGLSAEPRLPSYIFFHVDGSVDRYTAKPSPIRLFFLVCIFSCKADPHGPSQTYFLFLLFFSNILVCLIGGPLSLAFPLRLDLRELTLLSSSLGCPQKIFFVFC